MAYKIKSDGTNALLYQDDTLLHTFTVPATYSRSGDDVTLSETGYTITFGTDEFSDVENTTDRNLWVDAEITRAFCNEAPALPSQKLRKILRVTTDVVNATTSFASVTGLTAAVKSGKKYVFTAHLFHVSDATTTGAQFGIGGVAMTAMLAGAISTVTASATAAAMSAGCATAVDTAVIVQTTGSTAVVPTILTGYFTPSADGTFAIRCASEVAVAAGLTVKAGSWLEVFECDN